ncbi:MAG: hypothetical protein K2G26_02075, partial [Clostridia bacterium]|nr:hypothetical protein [Clostridia bacterium]
SNPVQNANTDIWFYPNTEANRKKYPNAPEKYFIHDNNIEVIDGKLYFDDDGTYRVYLRGRDNCALYYSADGKNYSLGAKITKDTPIETGKTNAYFRPSSAETYFDVKFDEGKVYIKSGSAENFPDKPNYTITADNNQIYNWLYIKEILICEKQPYVSYIGVGMRAWTEPQYTQRIRYYRDAACTQLVSDEEREAMTTAEAEKLYTKYYYLDNTGKEVEEKVVLAAKDEPPTVKNINDSQPYVNAYRSDYHFPNNSAFESDYFYVRNYNYNYVGKTVSYSTWDEGVKIVSNNKEPWDNTTAIDNILKDGQNTFFHSKKGADASTGAMVLELDMGKVINVNRITFYGRTTNPATTAGQG